MAHSGNIQPFLISLSAGAILCVHVMIWIFAARALVMLLCVCCRSIQGFMQKIEAEKMLLSCAPGTFLIRFSEGEPGGEQARPGHEVVCW